MLYMINLSLEYIFFIIAKKVLLKKNISVTWFNLKLKPSPSFFYQIVTNAFWCLFWGCKINQPRKQAVQGRVCKIILFMYKNLLLKVLNLLENTYSSCDVFFFLSQIILFKYDLASCVRATWTVLKLYRKLLVGIGIPTL